MDSPIGSSGESTSSSEQISTSRTGSNSMTPPIPHMTSSYEILLTNNNNNNDHHNHNLNMPHHHVSVPQRYVSVLSSCIEGSYTTNPLYAQSIHETLTQTQLKYEISPIHSSSSHFQRESGENLKNLDNIDENSNQQRVAIGKSSLSLTQIECICEAMLQRKDVKRLDDFLKSIPRSLHIGSEPVLRAKVHVLFYRQLFTEMYKLMQSYNYSLKYHAELQELWYQAHYKEQENVRGRCLGAVDKYRIRNKFQLPKTIWDGEKTTYCFKDRAREALKDCYIRCRYPTPNEKKALSEMTGLTSIQVSNWFKNKRQRDRTPQTREGNDGFSGNIGLPSPHIGVHGHEKSGHDSNMDLKPLMGFRPNSTKKLKLRKSFVDGRMSLLDLGRHIPLTRKENHATSTLTHVTITPRSTNHIPVNGISHSHPNEIHTHSHHPNSNGNNVSVIQTLAGAHCQFYPQTSPYDALIHSPHHYTNHASSPQILSYG